MRNLLENVKSFKKIKQTNSIIYFFQKQKNISKLVFFNEFSGEKMSVILLFFYFFKVILNFLKI